MLRKVAKAFEARDRATGATVTIHAGWRLRIERIVYENGSAPGRPSKRVIEFEAGGAHCSAPSDRVQKCASPSSPQKRVVPQSEPLEVGDVVSNL